MKYVSLKTISTAVCVLRQGILRFLLKYAKKSKLFKIFQNKKARKTHCLPTVTENCSLLWCDILYCTVLCCA